jgi:hypothetical protein
MSDQPDSVVVPREPTEAMLHAADMKAMFMHGEKDPARAIYAAMIAAAPISQAPAAGGGWQDIATAPKDGETIIWAKFRDDIYPALRPERKDLTPWNGVVAPLRHPGVYEREGRTWDHGWNIALPVGNGGFPDGWIEGWMPLPAAPSLSPNGKG